MLLEEFLKPMGISQSAFAVQLGVSVPRMNEIVRGKRGVTADTALRLVFGGMLDVETAKKSPKRRAIAKKVALKKSASRARR